MAWAVEAIPEPCHLALAALEALEEVAEEEEEASAEASKEVSKEAEAEADSVEALVVAVEADSEAVAATLALEAATEAATEAALEHPMEPRPALEDSTEETEIEASLVVGMSLEAADAHMTTDLAATEMAAVDMAIVTVNETATATATVIETVVTVVTVIVIETARDVGPVVTWNPLAAEKVGIGRGTMIAHAMKTTGSEDTRVVATRTLESCAATKLDDWCKSTQISTPWWVSNDCLTNFLCILSFTSQG